MNEPLNFSNNRNHDLLSRLTQTAAQLKLGQQNQLTSKAAAHHIDENANIAERDKSPYNDRGSGGRQMMSQKDQKRIDKIAETLRSAGGKNYFDFPHQHQQQQHHQSNKGPCPIIPHSPPTSMALKPPTFPPVSNFPTHFMADDTMPRTPENLMFEPQPTMLGENLCAAAVGGGGAGVDTMMEKPAMPKASNPKLYATCFICNKKLSNQYNLRVHLETHQNMR